MGLRSKFLIILIIFSVVPLLIFFLINQKLLDKLGDQTYKIFEVVLLQTTAKELQESADNYARNLNRELSHIVKHVQSNRDDIEKLLLQSETTSFSNRTSWIQEQIAQLIPIYFQRLIGSRIDLVSVNFFSVDGFSLSYPEMKNPRQIDNLFQDVASSTPDRPLWGLPDVYRLDGLEEQFVTVGLPVHYSDGSILGYIAIEFDILKLVKAISPASQWSSYMQSLLLGMKASQKTEDELPLVIGRRIPLSKKSEWKSETFLFNIDPKFEDETTALFQGMQYGKNGHVSVPFEGEVSVWAYSQTETGLGGLGILNILPEREALYRIASHRERLSRWLSLDSLLIVSVVVVIMVIIAAYRSRPMLAPFFSLVSAFKRLSAGDFSAKLDFKIRDERQMVADAFNNMTIQLEDGIRMRQGLEVAKEVQHNFFPEIDPSISDLDIGVRMSYCEETGGDYVDVLNGKGGKVCIVVGDVTGHGVGAALLMATIRALIRGHYEADTNLSQVITSVNFKLTADTGDSGRFVTLFIIEIDPTSQELRWVRAGHDPAWLFRNTDSSIVSLSGPGIALGVDYDLIYSESYRDRLESGDVILIGTDGIWETSSPDGTQFGKHNLERILSENSKRTAEEICDSVIDAVNHFRGTQNQEDDVSIAVIKIQ